MTQLRTLRTLIVCGCLSWASVGNADVVVDWNIITAQTIAAGMRPGPSPLFDYAMVHAAMHDAVQAFDGRFEPYGVAIPNASGSPVAAAAAAAHGVLVGLFPLQEGSLNTIYNDYLTAQGLSGDPGVAVGEQAALGILNMRMGDGRFPSNPEPFFGGSGPGPMASDLLLRNAPKPRADGDAVGGTGPSLHLERLGTVPRQSAAATPDQRRLRQGIRRGESPRSPRQQHPHPGADRDRHFLQ